MNTNEILQHLPGSWKELKLKDFLKLSELNVEEKNDLTNYLVGMQNSFNVLAILTGINIDELESHPMSKVTPLFKKIEFVFSTMPKVEANKAIKWKSFEAITYNDFINYQRFAKEPMKHLVEIIQMFSLNQPDKDAILEMDMETVMGGFFFLQKQTKHFLLTMKASLWLTLMKQKMKNLLCFKTKSKQPKQKSKRTSDGSSLQKK